MSDLDLEDLLESEEYCIGYQQGRADVIDEIKEYYKPCNDCNACLENDRDYFEKKCENDFQISYNELVEDLEKLKEHKK